MPNHDIDRLQPVQWVEIRQRIDRYHQGSLRYGANPTRQTFDPGLYPVRTDWNDGLVVGDPQRSDHIGWEEIDRYGRFLDENKKPCGPPISQCLRCRGTVFGCTSYACKRHVGSACEREQHSATWASYIEHLGDQRWLVVFETRNIAVLPTREEARIVIRAEKVKKAASDLGHYVMLSKKDFDAICEKLNLDPDDDALVDRLVTLGWEFNHVDEVYISPEKPEPPAARWRLLMEAMNDDA